MRCRTDKGPHEGTRHEPMSSRLVAGMPGSEPYRPRGCDRYAEIEKTATERNDRRECATRVGHSCGLGVGERGSGRMQGARVTCIFCLTFSVGTRTRQAAISPAEEASMKHPATATTLCYVPACRILPRLTPKKKPRLTPSSHTASRAVKRGTLRWQLTAVGIACLRGEYWIRSCHEDAIPYLAPHRDLAPHRVARHGSAEADVVMEIVFSLYRNSNSNSNSGVSRCSIRRNSKTIATELNDIRTPPPAPRTSTHLGGTSRWCCVPCSFCSFRMWRRREPPRELTPTLQTPSLDTPP